MAKFSPLMALPPVLFVGLASLFIFGMNRDAPDDLPSTFVGKKAPHLDVVALEGYSSFDGATLSDGELKLVNFWASWCPPCRAEHPTLMSFADQGLPVYGVTIRDPHDQSIEFLQSHGNPFTGIVADTTMKQAINWGVSAPPETFIVNGDGEILYKFTGPLIGSDLEQRFMPELENALALQEQIAKAAE
jgi:cytochrome c biogenesis protein CcmG, thiol:disulfide interchange protein DsbE